MRASEREGEGRKKENVQFSSAHGRVSAQGRAVTVKRRERHRWHDDQACDRKEEQELKVGTRPVDSNVGCQLYLPVFTPRFFTRSHSQPGSQNITSPIPDPTRLSLPTHSLARVLFVPGWITEALPLVPPRGWGWEIRTAMRLMLRDLELGSGMGGLSLPPLWLDSLAAAFPA